MVQDKKYYDSYSTAAKIDLDKVESFRKMGELIKTNFHNGNMSILDVGCGIGYLTRYLSRFGRAVGVDIASEPLETARRLYPELTFIHGDITDDESFPAIAYGYGFDVIVCNNVIEHMFDVRRARLFHRIKSGLLNPHGKIIFCYADPFHPAQLVWGVLTQKVLFDKTHVHNWSASGFRKLIASDFNILEVHRTSPFTRMIPVGKYLKGDIMVLAGLR